jgi:hypothetical protein
LAAYGSNRTVDQAVDLVGTDEWYTKTGEGNKRKLTYTKEDGTQKNFNMNKHVNYDKDNLPQEIKDFMAL